MAPLDRRTRQNREVRELDAATFFGEIFDRLVARHGSLVVAGIEALGARPLSVEADGAAWTIAVHGADLSVSAGVAADSLVLTLSEDQFSDWAQDVRSVHAFDVARELDMRNGDAHDLAVWDSLWRCLLDGWPVVGDPDFVDREGRPLELDRTFTPDDDPAEVAHFLREAGFLHLRGWIDPADAQRMDDEIERAARGYTEGDGRSWWARLADDSHTCVRIQGFLDESPTTAAILSGERWDHLRATLAAGDDLVQGRPYPFTAEALIKPVGVVAGPSDLPFHRDCHLGGHSYGCSGVDVGISVTDSGGERGHLQVVAGSHRIAIPVSVANTAPYLPVVTLPTRAGDCTVHLSCTLHESTAPVSQPRKVMYAPFRLAPDPDDVERPVSKNSELRERVYELLLDDQQPPH